MLTIASLVDVGDIPAKPYVPSGGGAVGVVATWRAVAEHVQLLSEACLVGRGELGWMVYGKRGICFLSLSYLRVNNSNFAYGVLGFCGCRG